MSIEINVTRHSPAPTVDVHDYCRQHTARSRFSHYDGTLERVARLAVDYLSFKKPGDKSKSWLVPVPPKGFYSSVVKVNPTTVLRATFGPRMEGEDSFISNVAVDASKVPAKVVELVLYETGRNEYQLVTIKARATEGPEPAHPFTMARNQRMRPGGSETRYTPEEWATAVLYWADKVFCAEQS